MLLVTVILTNENLFHLASLSDAFHFDHYRLFLWFFTICIYFYNKSNFPSLICRNFKILWWLIHLMSLLHTSMNMVKSVSIALTTERVASIGILTSPLYLRLVFMVVHGDDGGWLKSVAAMVADDWLRLMFSCIPSIPMRRSQFTLCFQVEYANQPVGPQVITH